MTEFQSSGSRVVRPSYPAAPVQEAASIHGSPVRHTAQALLTSCEMNHTGGEQPWVTLLISDSWLERSQLLELARCLVLHRAMAP